MKAEIYPYLRRLANKMSCAGDQYLAMKYWFCNAKITPSITVDLDGFRSFAKNEAMERWKYSCKIRKHIVYANKDWSFDNSTAVTCEFNDIASLFDKMFQCETQLEEEFSGAIAKAHSLGCMEAVTVISSMKSCYNKEHREIEEIRSKFHSIKTSADSIYTMNDKLREEYKDKYKKHD